MEIEEWVWRGVKEECRPVIYGDGQALRPASRSLQMRWPTSRASLRTFFHMVLQTLPAFHTSPLEFPDKGLSRPVMQEIAEYHCLCGVPRQRSMTSLSPMRAAVRLVIDGSDGRDLRAIRDQRKGSSGARLFGVVGVAGLGRNHLLRLVLNRFKCVQHWILFPLRC